MYQQDFNELAQKVVSCAEFSRKLAVRQAQLLSDGEAQTLSAVFPDAKKIGIKYANDTKSGKTLRYVVSKQTPDKSMGAYIDPSNRNAYVSAAFIQAASVTAMGYATRNQKTRNAAQKLHKASQMALNDCADYRHLVTSKRLRPVL